MVQERRPSTVHIGSHPQNLSFSGCGFLGVYHIGVASCFKQHAPKFLKSLKKVYGCSAGSIAGAMLLTDVCSGEVCRSTLEIVRDVRSRYLGPLSPGFKANKILLDGFRRVLPPEAHEKCDGKLYISLTRVSDGKNVIVSRYPSRDELINALLCSSFVPFYSGFIPPKYCGVYYVDGGITNNLPTGSETITVSPWSGGSDICPRDDGDVSLLDINIANTSVQMTVKNLHRLSTMLFPPECEVLSDFCKQGFRETLRYLREHGLFETVNPTLRSMSFSSELDHVDMKGKPCKKLSMTSKWADLQSDANLCIEELEWEDDESSDKSDDDCLMMNVGGWSEVGSNESEVCESEGDQLVSNIYDANHNQDDESHVSANFKKCIEENPHLKSLPITTVVHMSSSTNDLTSLLHFNLPHIVLQALEESYLDKSSRWHFHLAKVASFCGQPLIYTMIPLEKSYSLALLILKNCEIVPDNLKWLLSYISAVVIALQKHFQAKGADLIRKLKSAKQSLTDDLKLLSCQLCIIIQVLVQKIWSGRQTLDLSWILKITKGTNSISTFCKYLTS